MSQHPENIYVLQDLDSDERDDATGMRRPLGTVFLQSRLLLGVFSPIQRGRLSVSEVTDSPDLLEQHEFRVTGSVYDAPGSVHCADSVGGGTVGNCRSNRHPVRVPTRGTPTEVEQHLSLAAALYKEGKLDEALVEVREAVRLNPFDRARDLLKLVELMRSTFRSKSKDC
jgi:hypothetical protein